MANPKILKNTTGTDIEVERAGLTVLANSSKTINPKDYLALVEAVNTDTDFVTAIVSGHLVVNDGVGDLTPQQGITYLSYPGFIEVRNLDPVGSDLITRFTSKLIFGANLNVMVNEADEVVINAQASPNTDLVGKIITAEFGNDGGSSSIWLDNCEKGIRSNKSPVVAIWKMKLIGIYFSNGKSGVDIDLKIYSSAEGDGKAPLTKLFEWSLRNCRVARKTNFITDVIVDAGDKFGVFMSDQGTNPNDTRFLTVWQVIEDNSEENCENYSGNFVLSGGGGTTS